LSLIFDFSLAPLKRAATLLEWRGVAPVSSWGGSDPELELLSSGSGRGCDKLKFSTRQASGSIALLESSARVNPRSVTVSILAKLCWLCELAGLYSSMNFAVSHRSEPEQVSRRELIVPLSKSSCMLVFLPKGSVLITVGVGVRGWLSPLPQMPGLSESCLATVVSICRFCCRDNF